MPVSFQFEQQGPIGGQGGGEVPPWAMPSDGVITLVEVKYGLFLNQLIFHYTSATNGDGAITLGGFDAGSYHSQVSLAKGEEIRALQGRCGSYVDSIQIVTSMQTFPRRVPLVGRAERQPMRLKFRWEQGLSACSAVLARG